MPTLRERAANFLFGDIIKRTAKAAALAAVSVKVDDSPGWSGLGGGPQDRPWADVATDLENALEAWRKNFFIRSIVGLVRSYVVGGGITISSSNRTVDKFAREFWSHRQNQMARRLGPLCDELTRSGELFPVLFTNRVDGMSYVRFVPAACIREVETDPDDYEQELSYNQIQRTTAELKVWKGINDAAAFAKPDSLETKPEPLMLHYAVNRPVGAVRGESDLTPVLPWAKRYTEWLKDRVRLNRVRTRQMVLDIEIAEDSQVEAKRQQLLQDNPVESGLYVHGPGEKVTAHSLKIEADDAAEDGKALRLATVSGSRLALHYLGEGESTNYATAREMGEPTARFFSERQGELCAFLTDLVATAYRRKVALGLARDYADLQLTTAVTEVARADNAGLAKAAADIVRALATMKVQGWIDDPTAVSLAFKFAGEPLGEDEIARILKQAQPTEEPDPDPEADSDQAS